MMDTAAANADQKYLSYLNDLKGWKFSNDCNYHPNDVGIKAITSYKDGIKCYNKQLISVAIFGLGRIGMIHFQNIVHNPRAKLMYIAETCKERANYVQMKWNLPKELMICSETEEDRIFDDPKLDCVIICTPTYTHENLIVKALKAGKGVLCEKPISSSYEGISRCYELAEKAKKPLLCAFNRHFDPGFKQIKQTAKRDVGEIQIIKTCSRDSPLPSLNYLKTSGGIFHDCAVHDIDLICWILDEYPISVSVQAHAFVPNIKALDDFDTVGIMFKFRSGVVGFTDLSRFAPYGYDQRLEVFGPKGMLVSGDFHPTPIAKYSENGVTTTPIFYSFASRYREAYIEELEHFLDALRGFCEVGITKERVLAVNKIASACEESVKTGKVIQLEWT